MMIQGNAGSAARNFVDLSMLDPESAAEPTATAPVPGDKPLIPSGGVIPRCKVRRFRGRLASSIWRRNISEEPP